MDAEGNQYKQSGFSQIKTLHEAFLFNNTLILRRNVPADPPCSNKLSIWRQLLLASSHTKKDSPTTRWNCPRHFPRSALQKSLSESASNRFPVCAWNNFWRFFQNQLVILPNKEKSTKILNESTCIFWSEQRDLNPRPPRPERGALPTALCPENTAAYSAAVTGWGWENRTPTSRVRVYRTTTMQIPNIRFCQPHRALLTRDIIHARGLLVNHFFSFSVKVFTAAFRCTQACKFLVFLLTALPFRNTLIL